MGMRPARRMASSKLEMDIVKDWLTLGLVTTVPRRRRFSRYPSLTRICSACRMVGRLTPYMSASSTSEGMVCPSG